MCSDAAYMNTIRNADSAVIQPYVSVDDATRLSIPFGPLSLPSRKEDRRNFRFGGKIPPRQSVLNYREQGQGHWGLLKFGIDAICWQLLLTRSAADILTLCFIG